MIRIFALLLVAAFAVGSARDVVCQLTCAEPEAAHAAAGCHDSGNVASTLVQAAADHCIAIDSSPATTAVKVNPLKDQSTTAFTRTARSARPSTVAPPAWRELPRVFCSSPAQSTFVLRI